MLAASGLTALAGCLGAPRASPQTAPVTAGPGEVATDPAARSDLPVADDELVEELAPDAIPAIVDPVFGDDWDGVTVEVGNEFSPEPDGMTTVTHTPRLRDDDPVIGLVRDGVARAYPFRVLNWHEIVNDELAEPFLVTYCPLCRTALTTDRAVDGEVTRFGVSGKLYKNALVMYDELTESLWSQVRAQAIQGPMTGERLDVDPVTITTWGEWQVSHPETTVLRPPPESGTIGEGDGTRNYTVNPYVAYHDRGDAGLDDEFTDDRLTAQTEVLGLSHGDVARAYPTETIIEHDPIQDEIDGLPIVVTVTPDATPIAWTREINGTIHEFEAADGRHLQAADSRWNRATGVAVDGPHDGARLAQANAVSPLFWFAWLDFHPDTELYGQD